MTAVADEAVAGRSGVGTVFAGAGAGGVRGACWAGVPGAQTASRAANTVAKRHGANILLDCSDVPIALIPRG
ncbi:hypothetical protein GCM10027021_06990 [Dyella kyungheensis]